MKVRRATIADAPAITAIYNEGIASRQATLDTELRTPREIERRIANRATHATPGWWSLTRRAR